MTETELIKILQGILRTDTDLTFLLALERKKLERLVAVIRDRIEG